MSSVNVRDHSSLISLKIYNKQLLKVLIMYKILAT